MSDHDSVSYHYIVSVTDLESSVNRASQRVNTSGSENSCDSIRLNHLNIPLNFSEVGLPMQLLPLPECKILHFDSLLLELISNGIINVLYSDHINIILIYSKMSLTNKLTCY